MATTQHMPAEPGQQFTAISISNKVLSERQHAKQQSSAPNSPKIAASYAGMHASGGSPLHSGSHAAPFGAPPAADARTAPGSPSRSASMKRTTSGKNSYQAAHLRKSRSFKKATNADEARTPRFRPAVVVRMPSQRSQSASYLNTGFQGSGQGGVSPGPLTCAPSLGGVSEAKSAINSRTSGPQPFGALKMALTRPRNKRRMSKAGLRVRCKVSSTAGKQGRRSGHHTPAERKRTESLEASDHHDFRSTAGGTELGTGGDDAGSIADCMSEALSLTASCDGSLASSMPSGVMVHASLTPPPGTVKSMLSAPQSDRFRAPPAVQTHSPARDAATLSPTGAVAYPLRNATPTMVQRPVGAASAERKKSPGGFFSCCFKPSVVGETAAAVAPAAPQPAAQPAAQQNALVQLQQQQQHQQQQQQQQAQQTQSTAPQQLSQQHQEQQQSTEADSGRAARALDTIPAIAKPAIAGTKSLPSMQGGEDAAKSPPDDRTATSANGLADAADRAHLSTKSLQRAISDATYQTRTDPQAAAAALRELMLSVPEALDSTSGAANGLTTQPDQGHGNTTDRKGALLSREKRATLSSAESNPHEDAHKLLAVEVPPSPSMTVASSIITPRRNARMNQLADAASAARAKLQQLQQQRHKAAAMLSLKKKQKSRRTLEKRRAVASTPWMVMMQQAQAGEMDAKQRKRMEALMSSQLTPRTAAAATANPLNTRQYKLTSDAGGWRLTPQGSCSKLATMTNATQRPCAVVGSVSGVRSSTPNGGALRGGVTSRPDTPLASTAASPRYGIAAALAARSPRALGHQVSDCGPRREASVLSVRSNGGGSTPRIDNILAMRERLLQTATVGALVPDPSSGRTFQSSPGRSAANSPRDTKGSALLSAAALTGAKSSPRAHSRSNSPRPAPAAVIAADVKMWANMSNMPFAQPKAQQQQPEPLVAVKQSTFSLSSVEMHPLLSGSPRVTGSGHQGNMAPSARAAAAAALPLAMSIKQGALLAIQRSKATASAAGTRSPRSPRSAGGYRAGAQTASKTGSPRLGGSLRASPRKAARPEEQRAEGVKQSTFLLSSVSSGDTMYTPHSEFYISPQASARNGNSSLRDVGSMGKEEGEILKRGLPDGAFASSGSFSGSTGHAQAAAGPGHTNQVQHVLGDLSPPVELPRSDDKSACNLIQPTPHAEPHPAPRRMADVGLEAMSSPVELPRGNDCSLVNQPTPHAEPHSALLRLADVDLEAMSSPMELPRGDDTSTHGRVRPTTNAALQDAPSLHLDWVELEVLSAAAEITSQKYDPWTALPPRSNNVSSSGTARVSDEPEFDGAQCQADKRIVALRSTELSEEVSKVLQETAAVLDLPSSKPAARASAGGAAQAVEVTVPAITTPKTAGGHVLSVSIATAPEAAAASLAAGYSFLSDSSMTGTPIFSPVSPTPIGEALDAVPCSPNHVAVVLGLRLEAAADAVSDTASGSSSTLPASPDARERRLANVRMVSTPKNAAWNPAFESMPATPAAGTASRFSAAEVRSEAAQPLKHELMTPSATEPDINSAAPTTGWCDAAVDTEVAATLTVNRAAAAASIEPAAATAVVSQAMGTSPLKAGTEQTAEEVAVEAVPSAAAAAAEAPVIASAAIELSTLKKDGREEAANVTVSKVDGLVAAGTSGSSSSSGGDGPVTAQETVLSPVAAKGFSYAQVLKSGI